MSPEVLEWDWGCDNGRNTNIDWKKSHSIWRHAQALIDLHDDEFHLSDAISSLKRSVGHRLSSLSNSYNIPRISEALQLPKSSGLLQILEQLNVIRPAILKELIELRNKIEHQFDPPPPIEKCRQLSDAVWYFLKSTDTLSKWQKEYITGDDLTGNSIDIDSYLQVDFDPLEIPIIRASGNISNRIISLTERNSWILLEADEAHPFDVHKNSISFQNAKFIEGHSLLKIFRIYFETLF